jgi:hypothetical protein
MHLMISKFEVSSFTFIRFIKTGTEVVSKLYSNATKGTVMYSNRRKFGCRSDKRFYRI